MSKGKETSAEVQLAIFGEQMEQNFRDHEEIKNSVSKIEGTVNDVKQMVQDFILANSEAHSSMEKSIQSKSEKKFAGKWVETAIYTILLSIVLTLLGAGINHLISK